MTIPPGVPARPRSRPLAACLLLAALQVGLPAPGGGAGPGAWSDFYRLDENTNSIAVHMALVPGNGAHHSRLIWWLGKEIGGELGWNPASSEQCGSYPDATLTRIEGWMPGAEVFCGGHTQLASGELLTIGGSEPWQWGITDARSRAPATGSGAGPWTARGPMNHPRWYGTATTLRDNRILAASGTLYRHLWLVGGRRDGALPTGAPAYFVDRFARADASRWDSSQEAVGEPVTNDRPTMPREGHSLAHLTHFAVQGQVLFGGRGATGPISDGNNVWVLKRIEGLTAEPEQDDEYAYRWSKTPTSNGPPNARSEHAALAIGESEMVVLGGEDGTGPVSQGEFFWHLRRPAAGAWIWSAVTAPNAPSIRSRHAAAYDPATRTLYVFGGAEQGGGTSDQTLYAFTFNHTPGTPASGAWSTVTVNGAPPAGRRDHTMVWRTEKSELLLYGGTLASGTDDAVWRVNFDPATGSPGWTALQPTPRPSPRTDHAAFYDGEKTHRMYIHGGDLTVPGEDRRVWSFELDNSWKEREMGTERRSGHVLAVDPQRDVFARIPEIFNPADGSWTAHPQAAWRQSYYPLHFVVPGGPSASSRVLAVGQLRPARYLDIPDGGAPGTWQDFPGNDFGYPPPQTAVTYAPGKIMAAGSSFALSGVTKTIDATGTTPGGWQTCGSSMEPRNEHNFVVLPDGKVLVVGGTKFINPGDDDHGDTANPDLAVPCPQLWDPVTCTWTPISGAGSLACDMDGATAVVRNYHSTAVLLPDGRVLTAGGWPEKDPPVPYTPPPYFNLHRKEARIYCPPYLFQSDGTTPISPTARPAIAAAPCRLDWGTEFVIQTPAATDIAVGGKACLIRPAAVTHSFDQAQRYVPLTVVDCPGGDRLRVQSPASASHAPPGDYMLFLVNSAGIPSIARWVRVGPAVPGGCDIVAPAQTTDFTVDIVWETGAETYWTAPGDDGTSGTATEYDVRRAGTSPSEVTFCTGTRVATPGPQAPGSWEYLTVDGLTPCTQYFVALKTRDEVANWAGLGNVGQFTTVCSGGGGGSSAREVAAPLARLGGPQEPVAPYSRIPVGGAALAASMQIVDGAPVWTVHHLSEAEAAAVAGSDSASVIAQVPNGSGGWLTRARRSPTGSRYAIRSGRSARRLVFLGDFALEIAARAVAAGAAGASRDQELVAARHSRLGDVKPVVEAAGGYELGLVRGDTLTLRYAPADRAATGARDEFLRITAGSALSQPAGRSRPGGSAPAPPAPDEFALHANQPNPFSRQTSIRFALPTREQVRLQVFDLVGRRVRTLALGGYEPGEHAVVWDGRDEGGHPVPSGVYHCRLEAGRFQARRTMVVLP